MNTKAIIYGTCAISLMLNYFTLQIAAPVYKESIKQATANHLMHLASDLRPKHPTVIPAVTEADMEADMPRQAKTMPPRMDLGEIATAYPAANSDIIRELLEAN